MKAISIRKYEYSESSQIISFLTEESVNIKMIAKGIKRPKKGMDGPIDLGAVYDIRYYESKNGLSVLTHCKLIYSFPNIKKSLGKLFALNLLLEIIGNFILEKMKVPGFYKLITNILYSIEQKPDFRQYVLYFLGNCLTLSGYAPDLRKCVECSSLIGSELYFSSLKGGIMCSTCSKREGGVIPMKGPTLAGMRLINDKMPLTKVLLEDKQTLLDLFKIYIYYYTDILGYELRSPQFLFEYYE